MIRAVRGWARRCAREHVAAWWVAAFDARIAWGIEGDAERAAGLYVDAAEHLVKAAALAVIAGGGR